jgi:hypothetical protein
MSQDISLNDIKYDLLKIIEPYDGVLEVGKPRPVRHLFVQYLRDLQKEKSIYDFSIDTTDRSAAITFDITIRMAAGRSPKKLKIHVGVFTAPWVSKAA